jgi:hypothetical protein
MDQMGIATMVKAPRPELARSVDYTPRAGEGTLRSPYAESSRMREARELYFKANGLPPDGGYDSRKRAAKVRDLHHVVTGYATTWTGAFEIAAWEIGAGCADFFAAWIGNLGAMFGGLLLAPRRTYRAFVRGRRSQSLYGREDLELVLEKTVGETRALMHVPNVNPPSTGGDVAVFVLAEIAGLFAGLIALVLFPFSLLLAAVGKRPRRA